MNRIGHTHGGAARTGARGSAHAVMLRQLVTVAIVAATAFVAGCAHGPPHLSGSLASWQEAPAADSVTLALWHLDETAGDTAEDAGRMRLTGSLGLDTRPTFGRFRGGRSFQASMNSFVYVPPDDALNLGDTWTIEAWVRPDGYALVECGAIAARWSQSVTDQSWLFGLTGYNRIIISDAPAPPLVFTRALGNTVPGLVGFIYQAEAASEPRAFVSTLPVPLNRWTHVAVTRSETELQIYLDGRLDAQYALAGRVRAGTMPLVIGNVIDPRWTTTSEGPLRVLPRADLYPFYAFRGAIDELRISTVSRASSLTGR